MEKWMAQFKKEWKLYTLTTWMVLVTGLLIYLLGTIHSLSRTQAKISSDVSSIESILISTDGNVAEVKSKMDGMSSRVIEIHKRVRRR